MKTSSLSAVNIPAWRLLLTTEQQKCFALFRQNTYASIKDIVLVTMAESYFRSKTTENTTAVSVYDIFFSILHFHPQALSSLFRNFHWKRARFPHRLQCCWIPFRS